MMRVITTKKLSEEAYLGRVLRGLCASWAPSELAAARSSISQLASCNEASGPDVAAISAARSFTAASVTTGHTAPSAAQLVNAQTASLHSAACRAAGSSAAADSATAVSSMQVSPGSQIILDLRQSAADVQILTSEDPEAISWDVSSLLAVSTWQSPQAPYIRCVAYKCHNETASSASQHQHLH